MNPSRTTPILPYSGPAPAENRTLSVTYLAARRLPWVGNSRSPLRWESRYPCEVCAGLSPPREFQTVTPFGIYRQNPTRLGL